MTHRNLLLGLFVVFLGLNFLVFAEEWPVLKGPYLGQKAPADRAGLFMDGIVVKRQ